MQVGKPHVYFQSLRFDHFWIISESYLKGLKIILTIDEYFVYLNIRVYWKGVGNLGITTHSKAIWKVQIAHINLKKVNGNIAVYPSCPDTAWYRYFLSLFCGCLQKATEIHINAKNLRCNTTTISRMAARWRQQLRSGPLKKDISYNTHCQLLHRP